MRIANNVDDWEWIVFDIDGVLIDVSRSYDLAVLETATMFLEKFGIGYDLSLQLIRDFRRKGAFGDDYRVTEGLILAGFAEDPVKYLNTFPEGRGIASIRERFDSPIDTGELVEKFDQLYLGEGSQESGLPGGLWRRESLLVDVTLIKRLEDFFQVGFITGRSKREVRLAERTLSFQLTNVVTRDDQPLKPHPGALEELVGEEPGVYIGDTTNDRLLVENFNKEGHDFDFLRVTSEPNSTNALVKEIIQLAINR